MAHAFCPSRRSALILACGAFALPIAQGLAAEDQAITVHKDPNCGCCTGWAQHLQTAGFIVRVVETTNLESVKSRLGVPTDLDACHTGEIADYIVEGHVPAVALKRFLAEKPSATGLAVPGMPIGSPGMEGGEAEAFEVVIFGPSGRRTNMRFRGDRVLS